MTSLHSAPIVRSNQFVTRTSNKYSCSKAERTEEDSKTHRAMRQLCPPKVRSNSEQFWISEPADHRATTCWTAVDAVVLMASDLIGRGWTREMQNKHGIFFLNLQLTIEWMFLSAIGKSQESNNLTGFSIDV